MQKWPHVWHAEAALGPHYINIKFPIGDILTFALLVYIRYIYVSLVSVLMCTLLPIISDSLGPCQAYRSGPMSDMQKWPCVQHAGVALGLHYINIKFLIDDMLTYCTFSVYQIYLCVFSVNIHVYTCFYHLWLLSSMLGGRKHSQVSFPLRSSI